MSSEQIGQRIRRLRKESGLTQRELSLSLKISVSYLSALERGDRMLSRSLADRLCRHFKISYDYLFIGRQPLPPAILHTSPQRQELTHRLLVLIETCSIEELTALYQICSHYLMVCREKGQFRGKS